MVMHLSDFGKIVNTEWNKSFEIRSELFLDKYIIMPNHIHAIVVLDNNTMTNTVDGNIVDTHGRAYQRYQNHPFYRMPKSISSFLAGFKSSVNTKIDDYIDENGLDIPKYNRTNHFFQPDYYDHIIRDELSYRYISAYIINNPAKWTGDKFYLQ